MHSDSCSTSKERINIQDLHVYVSELKQPFPTGTLHHHFEQQGSKFEDTVRALKENTYAENWGKKLGSHAVQRREYCLT